MGEKNRIPTNNLTSKNINSLEEIKIGGINQWILIRGKNIDNPLLLFLHGGPGAAQIAFAPKFQSELEENFIVVNWDQRGSGKSYSSKIPKESMNVDQFVRDTHELVNYLLRRFNKDKIYLAAHSWGSVFGLIAVKRYPELFQAYIGIGQAVDMQETSKILCEYNSTVAKKTNNKKAIKELGGVGDYYIHNKTTRDAWVQIKWLERFGGIFEKRDVKKTIVRELLFSPDYTLLDKARYKLGNYFSFEAVFNELMRINLFKQVPEIKVPAYFCVGCYDYNTPFKLSEQFFKRLKAPWKKIFWFGKSGHAPHFEEPEKFADIFVTKILPETAH